MSVLREDAGDVRLRLLQSATGDNNPAMALAYDGFDIGLSSGNILEFLSYNNHRTPKQIFTLNQDTTNGNVALFTDGDSDVSAAQASVHIQTKEQDPSLLLKRTTSLQKYNYDLIQQMLEEVIQLSLNLHFFRFFRCFNNATSELGSSEDAYTDKENIFNKIRWFDFYSSVRYSNFCIGDSERTASIG